MRHDQDVLRMHATANRDRAREQDDKVKENVENLRDLYVRLEKDLECATVSFF